jgi:hypothetical protein
MAGNGMQKIEAGKNSGHVKTLHRGFKIACPDPSGLNTRVHIPGYRNPGPRSEKMLAFKQGLTVAHKIFSVTIVDA